MNTTSALAPALATTAAPQPARVRSASFGASTPARMRLLSAVTALCAILLALVGWVAVSRRDAAIDRAGGAATRLIAVQQIRTAVIEADSIATTTFLVPALEPPEQRARFETRLADAAGGLALLTPGDGAQRDRLMRASATVSQFSGLVEQARANNRQGYPVGAAYQRQASALVRTDLLTSLDDLEGQARSEVNRHIAEAHRIGWVLPLLAIVAAASMVVGALWLYRRTRRILNVPLTIATLLTVAVAAYAVATMSKAMSDADAVVIGDLRVADQLSQARVAAFEGRSDEALTLINRGNGAANEQGFQTARSRVEAVLSSRSGDGLSDAYVDYATVHDQLRELDTSGKWEDAVALLRNESATAFDSFSGVLESNVRDRATSAQAHLDDAGSGLRTARLAIVLAALVAAALVVVGYGQRLREYR